MAPAASPRSRISRETRLLLMTILLSVIALLVLGRLRFPGRPATPALVPPLLSQLAPPSPFEDLSNAVLAMEAEIVPSLHLLTLERGSAGTPEVIPALRFRDDAAVALVDAAQSDRLDGVFARDRATGLAVIRTPSSRAPALRVWPQRTEYPRYLLVTETSSAGASLRPVFMGPVQTAASLRWESPVSLVARHSSLTPGAYVFTTTGALVGLVVAESDARAIVPAESLIAAAGQLLTARQPPGGSIGLAVQDLTPSIRSATGSASGVIVVHVDPDGPAAGHLVPTDVIERIGDDPVTSRFEWDGRLARLTAGETVSLHVRRHAQTREIRLTAANRSAEASPSLGLTMRSRPPLGAEVIAVDAGSIAERAGIRAGDILTRAGDVASPTSAQVKRAFDSLAPGGAVLVAISRGADHTVVAVTKP